MIVQYKGKYIDECEREKKNIGELWKEKSREGKVTIFLWVTEKDDRDRDVYQKITDKIKGKL